MGSSVSSLHKLRKQFLIQLFQLGLCDVTLVDVFMSLEGDTKLKRDDFLNLFGFQSHEIIDEVFGCKILSSGVTSIPLSYVLSFLENGSINQRMREHCQVGMNAHGVYPEVWKLLNVYPGECSSALSRTKLLALSEKHQK